MKKKKIETDLDRLWYALPSWRRVINDETGRFVYAQRGAPGRWKLINLTSLTPAERAIVFEDKAAQGAAQSNAETATKAATSARKDQNKGKRRRQ